VAEGEQFEFSGTERFVVQRRLGEGGMGVVYEALDRELNIRVALKTLRRVDAQALYLLKREFRSLQDLEHPNLVSLGELIEASGEWFFTMELVEGVDFLQYVRPGARPAPSDAITLRAEPPQPPPAAAVPTIADVDTLPGPRGFDEDALRRATGQLALGLAALHRAGKIHRDIKPSNIRVTAEGRVVLLDFGLIAESSTDHEASDAAIVGTAAYMAPEQAASKALGPETDWYSVGIVLYEALTGRLPFGGTPIEIFMDKQKHEPPPPRALVPLVPRDLDALCVDLLHFDPRSRPAEADILKRLGLAPSGPVPRLAVSSQRSLDAPFVGRASELGRLRDSFADTRRGNPVTVYVRGESGVGKSALLRKFVDTVATQVEGAVVVQGRCYERETVPFKAFDGVVDALSRYMRRLPDHEAAALLPRHAALLPRVFPVLGRVEMIAQAPLPRHDLKDPHELRARVFGALRELLFRIAERNPFVVVVDDLQWADADSLLLLGDLMRPPDAPPLLFLIASRTDPGPTKQRGPTGSAPILPGYAVHLDLKPLALDDARALAALLLEQVGADGAADPEAIALEARGHPLYIDELVRRASHAATPDGGRLRLDEAIWARVEKLPQPTARVLELIAVAGVPVSREVLARAGKLDPQDLARHVSQLRVAHLIRMPSGNATETFDTYHSRVTEAVLQQMGDARRKECHTRLAIALEGTGAATERPELVVRHLERAGQTQKAATYAEEGAQRAARGLAFERAAELYRAALRLGEPDPETQRSLQVRLAEALANAGRSAEAAEVFLAAAPGANAVDVLDLQRRAAAQYLRAGHVSVGIAALRTVLGAVGLRLARTPRRALTSLLLRRLLLRLRGIGFRPRDPTRIAAHDLMRIDVCRSAATGLGLVDPIRGADFQVRHLLLALRAGEAQRVGLALALDIAYAPIGGARRTARTIAAAQRLAEELDDPLLLGSVAGGTALVEYQRGDLRGSREHAQRAARIYREQCKGVAYELASTELFTLWSTYYLGELRALSDRVIRRLKEAHQRGDQFTATSLRTSVLNAIWLAADNPDQAQHEAEQALRRLPEDAYHVQHYWTLLALGQRDLYLGEGTVAYERLAGEQARIAEACLLRVSMIRTELLHLRVRATLAAALEAANPYPLLAEAERSARALGKEATSWARPMAALAHAALASARGDGAAAIGCLEAAVRGFEAHGMASYAAAARRRLGGLRSDAEGAALIEDADDWMRCEGIRAPERMTRMLAPGFDQDVAAARLTLPARTPT
jgi:serine/threonine protein kinase/tetratricopeptide (TPR) repeat protein